MKLPGILFVTAQNFIAACFLDHRAHPVAVGSDLNHRPNNQPRAATCQASD